MDQQVFASIRAIVEYSTPSERADYEREGEPEGHVFEHLRRVAQWLQAPCTCEDGRGACSVCWARAKEMIGARIRDRHGREWTVEAINEKDDWITLSGGRYGAMFEDNYEILEPPEAVDA